MLASRSAVCALWCLAIGVSACSPASTPLASQKEASPGPTSSPSTAVAKVIDYNCSEQAACTFEPGQYVLSDAQADYGALLPGLGFTLSDQWTSVEAWLGALELHTADGSGSMAILVDMLPVTQDGEGAAGVENNAAAIVAALASNASLVATDITQTSLGEDVPATEVTLAVSPSWVNVDPTCPVGACSTFLGRPDWWCCVSIGLGDHVRIYVADIGTPGSSPHTLMILLGSVEDSPAISEAALAGLDVLVRPILDSLILPEELVIYCGDTRPAHRC